VPDPFFQTSAFFLLIELHSFQALGSSSSRFEYHQGNSFSGQKVSLNLSPMAVIEIQHISWVLRTEKLPIRNF
jgi:hypothetical protein